MSAIARPVTSGARSLVAVSILVALMISACSSASPSGSPGPASPGPSSPVPAGEIDHATGPTDLLLRFEEGGGFVPIGFLLTQAPAFSLFGDGTVIVRDPSTGGPAAGDGIIRDAPFRVAHLDEDLIQRVLDVALNRARLDTAAARYENPFVADAPTAIFTVNAGGVAKTVEVYGLGMDAEGVPDPEIRRLLAELADDLRSFELSSGLEFETWLPDRYRGLLFDDGGEPMGGGAARPWPWADIQPADFVSPGPDAFPDSPRRTLTAADVERLALVGIEGGAQSIRLSMPNGTLHVLALRPLLPDEAS